MQVSSNYFANVNNNGNANYNNASNENGVRPISHPCILSRILTHGNGKGKIVRSGESPINNNCDGSGYDQ